MFKRKDLLKRYQGMVKKGEPIVGGGAGTGLSAKCEEAGGIDLIVIYNSGRFRMAGRGSLAGWNLSLCFSCLLYTSPSPRDRG